MKILKHYTKFITRTEDWLLSLVPDFKHDGQFEKIGNPICDGVVFPKCP